MQQDLLPRHVGDLRREEHPSQPSQDAHVGVVGAGRAQRHPERQRDRQAVVLVGDALMPRAVGDRADDQLELGEIVLRPRNPVCRAGILALQHQAGEAHSGGIDPVVVLRILVHVPGAGKGLVHAVRLVP